MVTYIDNVVKVLLNRILSITVLNWFKWHLKTRLHYITCDHNHSSNHRLLVLLSSIGVHNHHFAGLGNKIKKWLIQMIMAAAKNYTMFFRRFIEFQATSGHTCGGLLRNKIWEESTEDLIEFLYWLPITTYNSFHEMTRKCRNISDQILHQQA